MRIGPYERIGVSLGQLARLGMGVLIRSEHDPGQVLQVHLMHDAGVGRNYPEVFERPLPPPQELIALAVPLVVELDVCSEGLRRPEGIYLNRVIHNQLDRLQRIDPAGVTTQCRHGISHGS